MPRHHVPPTAIASFIDRQRIERLLAPWVPDEGDRAFVVRCLLDEGPAHHRGANYVLLVLLGELAAKLGVTAAPSGPSAGVPMRLPAGVSPPAGEGAFPLRLPTALLERLAKPGTPEHDAMIDCLTDGPPQHSLANAAMMCLLTSLLGEGAA